VHSLNVNEYFPSIIKLALKGYMCDLVVFVWLILIYFSFSPVVLGCFTIAKTKTAFFKFRAETVHRVEMASVE